MTNISVCSLFDEQEESPQYCLKPQNIVCSNPEYYGQLFGLVGTVCQSSIFLVGVLGNLMVVVTVRGTKSLHTTTNCYLVSLALADLITLLSSVPQEVLSYHILGRCHTVTLSHCHTVTVSHCHSVALSHSHTLTLS